MAELNILMRLKDEATRQLNNFTKQLGMSSQQMRTMGFGMVGVGVAIAGGLGLAVKAAADEEKGIIRLRTAMRNMGMEYDAVRNSLEDWINTQQYKTTIADSDQRNALSDLILMTGNLTEAQDLLTLAMDMSIGMGKDLASVTATLGYAIAGNWGMVNRMLPAMANIIEEEEKWLFLRNAFAGSAEAYGKSVAGSFDTIKNSLSDVMENMGTVLLPTVQKGTDLIIKFLTEIKNMSPEMSSLVVQIGLVTSGLSILGGGFLILISYLPQAIAGLKTFMTVLTGLAGMITGIVAGLGMMAIGISQLVAQHQRYSDASERQQRIAELSKKAVEGDVQARQELLPILEDQIEYYDRVVQSGRELNAEEQEFVLWMKETAEAIKQINQAQSNRLAIQQQLIEQQRKMAETTRKTQLEWLQMGEVVNAATGEVRDFFSYMMEQKWGPAYSKTELGAARSAEMFKYFTEHHPGEALTQKTLERIAQDIGVLSKYFKGTSEEPFLHEMMLQVEGEGLSAIIERKVGEQYLSREHMGG